LPIGNQNSNSDKQGIITTNVNTDLVTPPLIQQKSKNTLIIAMIVVIGVLVCLFLPILLCVCVPWACPNSSLALWIFLQKEKYRQTRGNN